MRTRMVVSGVVLVFALAVPVFADLAGNEMAARGFTLIANEVGTSGLTSSYHGQSMGGAAMSSLPTFGPGRVSYPSGVGQVPSPGGNTGRAFDEGVLGYKLDANGNLTVGVACGLDARNWSTVSGYGSAKFGQGDLFVDVLNNGTVTHYALLNSMNSGNALGHNGHFDAAQSFRNGAGHTVGQLVQVTSDSDITLSGGSFGYTRGGNSPAGLDERAFAKGGTGMGVGTLAFESFTADEPLGNGSPMTWYVSEWTLPVSIFGTGILDLAFHIVPICGNDQISGTLSIIPTTPVPAPGAILLGGIGLGIVSRIRRRFA